MFEMVECEQFEVEDTAVPVPSPKRRKVTHVGAAKCSSKFKSEWGPRILWKLQRMIRIHSIVFPAWRTSSATTRELQEWKIIVAQSHTKDEKSKQNLSPWFLSYFNPKSQKIWLVEWQLLWLIFWFNIICILQLQTNWDHSLDQLSLIVTLQSNICADTQRLVPSLTKLWVLAARSMLCNIVSNIPFI